MAVSSAVVVAGLLHDIGKLVIAERAPEHLCARAGGSAPRQAADVRHRRGAYRCVSRRGRSLLAESLWGFRRPSSRPWRIIIIPSACRTINWTCSPSYISRIYWPTSTPEERIPREARGSDSSRYSCDSWRVRKTSAMAGNGGGGCARVPRSKLCLMIPGLGSFASMTNPMCSTGCAARSARVFIVETAIGGRLGLEILQAKGPFVVVTSDLRMPLMNGVEFLIRGRARLPRIPSASC